MRKAKGFLLHALMTIEELPSTKFLNCVKWQQLSDGNNFGMTLKLNTSKAYVCRMILFWAYASKIWISWITEVQTRRSIFLFFIFNMCKGTFPYYQVFLLEGVKSSQTWAFITYCFLGITIFSSLKLQREVNIIRSLCSRYSKVSGQSINHRRS